MARYFLDSSALVKRYHQESGSSNVDGLFQETGSRILISRLAVVEVYSCFARLVREGSLTDEGFEALVLRLNEDVALGAITVAALSSQRLDEASSLLSTRGRGQPMRTLDAIHLATAQSLNGRTRIASFVAADKQLLSAADTSGLAVLDVG